MDAAANVAARQPRAAAAGALAAGVGGCVTAVTFFGGASGDGSVAWLGLLGAVLLLGAAGLAALGLIAVPRLDGVGWAAFAALLCLVGWWGIGVIWSVAADRSWSALNKGLLYLVLFGAGVLLGALGSRTARVAAGLLGAAVGLALVWALAGKAIPAFDPDGDRIARVRDPVGYWNGLALLADAALALGLWLLTATTRRVVIVGGALLVYSAVLALALTQSRAGVVAGAVVVAFWLAVATTRLAGAIALASVAVPAVVVVAWAFSREALVEDGAARADRVDDGVLFAAFALAGAVMAATVVLIPLARLAVEHRRLAQRVLVATAAIAAVLATSAAVASVGNPIAWAGDQFSQGECVNDPSRLGTLCANNRLQWWQESLEVWRERPLAGAGANTFRIARTPFREDGTDVTQPHSIPLQQLADGGLVGLALLLALAGALAVGVVRSLRRLGGAERPAAVALAAFPVAWAVHALVDYDLDFLAVTGPTLVASGALLAAGRPARARPSRLAVAATALVVVAGIASWWSPELAGRGVERTAELLDEGRVADAADVAELAQRLDPLSIDPLEARAVVSFRAGDVRSAEMFYERATELQPENARTWYLLGVFRLQALGDACGGYAALNHAYTLDPKGRAWTKGGLLDRARDAVNAGACEGE
jgi:tetratricopeptide (TPR) repeat protein